MNPAQQGPPRQPQKPPSPEELFQAGVGMEIQRVLQNLLKDATRVEVNSRYAKEVSKQLRAVGWNVVKDDSNTYITWGPLFGLPTQKDNKKFLERDIQLGVDRDH